MFYKIIKNSDTYNSKLQQRYIFFEQWPQYYLVNRMINELTIKPLFDYATYVGEKFIDFDRKKSVFMKDASAF